MKRFLSIALAVMLGVAVLMPGVSADGVMMGGPNAPIITKQPANYYFPDSISNLTSHYVQAGNAFQLDVEAVLPEGSQGELSYAWYGYNWQPGDTKAPVATGASVSLPTTEDMVLKEPRTPNTTYNFCVVVTNTWFDDEQVQHTASVKSDLLAVTIFVDYGTALSITWNGAMDNGLFAFLINLPSRMFSTFFNLFGVLGCKVTVWTFESLNPWLIEVLYPMFDIPT